MAAKALQLDIDFSNCCDADKLSDNLMELSK